MDVGGFGAVVGDGDAPEEISGGGFGDFLEDIEVASVIKYPEVGEFEFGFES